MRALRPSLLIPLLVPLAFACGEPVTRPGVEDPQAAALAALASETGAPWTVRYHDDVHTPAFLEGRTAPLLDGRGDAVKAARSFLDGHRALFRLTDPARELQSEGASLDELGMVHVRFAQVQGGVPVHGGEITLHFDPVGALVRVHARYTPLPTLTLVPSVAHGEARRAALAAVTATRPDAAAASLIVGAQSLRIDPSASASPRVAWSVEVLVEEDATPDRLEVWIDAATGEAYRIVSQLDDLAGSGRGVRGEVQPLDVALRRGRFWLEDSTGDASPQRTHSAGGKARLPGTEVSSDLADRWDDVGPAAGAAVDAHAFVATATAYFARTHGRAGALDDGHGLRSTVHFGDRFAGAFWNGRQLVFGDGDGVLLAPLSGALDVVAHELTHAVLESSTRLEHVGQPGALNEAIADLFACFVEHDARGSAANWTIGEDVSLHAPLRDLRDPHRLGQPAHVDEWVATSDDRGGVHLNSAIVSHAGFLMSEGGTNRVSRLTVDGVGRAAAQKIWYRALRRYLRPGATFRDAADATLAAARDLHGPSSAAETATRDAWLAVGVLPP